MRHPAVRVRRRTAAGRRADADHVRGSFRLRRRADHGGGLSRLQNQIRAARRSDAGAPSRHAVQSALDDADGIRKQWAAPQSPPRGAARMA